MIHVEYQIDSDLLTDIQVHKFNCFYYINAKP